MRFAFLLAVALFGCTPQLEIVKRIESRANSLEIVVANRLTGATAATPTEIYILDRGEYPIGEPVWRADKVIGLKISWLDANTVIVEADEAREFLKNFEAVIPRNGKSEHLKVAVKYRIARSI